MKHKALSLALASLLTVFSLSGCSGENGADITEALSNEIVTESVSDETEAEVFNEKILTDAEWLRYDENIGENVDITFTEEHEYFYCCDCGEPVGASDIYDTYSVDSASRTIKLSGPDEENSEIGILYADGNYLYLMFEDGAVLFKNEYGKIDDTVHVAAEEYMPDGTYAMLSILSYVNNVLMLAPYDYDGDAHASFADRIYELTADDDIKFYSVSVTTCHYDDSEDEISVNRYELGTEDISEIGESYHTGYVTFGDDGEVESIVFYGTLEIW